MEDFLAFRKMLTPLIIQIVFWLGLIVCVLGGLAAIIGGNGLPGLFMLFLGPIAVRIYCEILILVFRMNDTLTDIKNAVEKTARNQSNP